MRALRLVFAVCLMTSTALAQSTTVPVPGGSLSINPDGSFTGAVSDTEANGTVNTSSLSGSVNPGTGAISGSFTGTSRTGGATSNYSGSFNGAIQPDGNYSITATPGGVFTGRIDGLLAAFSATASNSNSATASSSNTASSDNRSASGVGSSGGSSGLTGTIVGVPPAAQTEVQSMRAVEHLNAALLILERENSRCDPADTDLSLYLGCLADNLDSFADKVEATPPTANGAATEAVPVLRQAAARVRTATTVEEARVAVAAAVEPIRKSIALVRAGGDDIVTRQEALQRSIVVSALSATDSALVKAVGL